MPPPYPAAGPLICAVHTEVASRPGPCFVTHWSGPGQSTTTGGAAAALLFPLGNVEVSGDVRISVFALDVLLEARHDRTQHGEPPGLPFDRASSAPWGANAEPRTTRAPKARQQKRDSRRIIAGKEPGCLFYFLFHTGFVGAEDELTVRPGMMDKAFKDRKGRYHAEGAATLRFARPLASESVLCVASGDASKQGQDTSMSAAAIAVPAHPGASAAEAASHLESMV